MGLFCTSFTQTDHRTIDHRMQGFKLVSYFKRVYNRVATEIFAPFSSSANDQENMSSDPIDL